MSFGPKEFNKAMLYMEAVSYKQHLKEIKITNDFYNYLAPKCIAEIKHENTPEGIVDKFIGIPVVIDNTIDDNYELIFEKENHND